MGRRRTKTPDWLPKRCYPHGRQILYRPLKGKPVKLGPLDDPGACLKKYGEIVGVTGKRPESMGDVIDKYLSEVVPGLAPRTQEDYRAYCAKLKHAFGDMLPDEITINDLYEYHSARQAPVRANREITILGLIYRHAIRWRAASTNPVRSGDGKRGGGFLFHKERGRDREVTGSERRRFASGYCADWMRGYLALKYLTARRQGELLKLGLFSETKVGIAFRILKKRKPRELIVQWTPRLRRVWEWCKRLRRPASSLMLFHGERAKVMNARAFKSAWQRAQAKWEEHGNIGFWEHDIRAAAGAASKSDEEARELLDHESVTTTRRSYRRASVVKIKPLR